VYLEGEIVISEGFGRVEMAAGTDPYILADKNSGNFVEIGAGPNRSEMGITIKSAGNDILTTDTTSATFGNVDITGDLTISSAGLVEANDDFRLDPGGLQLKEGGFGTNRSIDWYSGTFSGSDREASIAYGDSAFSNPNVLQIEAPKIHLAAENGNARVSTLNLSMEIQDTDKLVTFQPSIHRSSHPSSLGLRKFAFYSYNGEVWVAIDDGNGGVNKTKLV
jgi:hypothetical protein